MMERLAVVETRLGGVEMRLDRLEGRMDRLEGRMDGIDGRLRGVEMSLATLTERVAHLPSKGYIFAVASTIIAAIIGFTTFADTIRAWLGL